MTELKKLLRPVVLFAVCTALTVILWNLYVRMYNGEYKTREARIRAYEDVMAQDNPLEYAYAIRDAIDAQTSDLEEMELSAGLFGESDQERALSTRILSIMNGEGQYGETLNADYLVLNALIKRMNHIDAVERSWQEREERLRRAAKRKQNERLLAEALELSAAYSSMHAPGYGNYEPAEDFIRWNQEDGWAVLFVLVWAIGGVFSIEYRLGMHALLRSVALRPMRIALKKACAVFLCVVGTVTLIFAAGMMIVGYAADGFWALSQPIQGLYDLGDSSTNLLVWQLILLQYLTANCCAIFCAGLVMLISAFTSNTWVVAPIGLVCLIIPNALYSLFGNMEWLDLTRVYGVTDWIQDGTSSILTIDCAFLFLGCSLAMLACRKFGGDCLAMV